MGLPDLRAIRKQCEQIRAQKRETFPPNSMVRVESDRFHGIGIVAYDDDGCPLEKLPVRVESLNVWWYPIEDCQPYHGKMPSWIRSLFREHKMRRVDSPFAAETKENE